MTPEQKEQIRDLIILDELEAALDAFIDIETNSAEAMTLRARFLTYRRQFDAALIDYGMWQRNKADITHGLLELIAGSPIPVWQPSRAIDKREIIDLYERGNIELVFHDLATAGVQTAISLQARWNAATRQYQMGLIDKPAWRTIRREIFDELRNVIAEAFSESDTLTINK